MPSATNLTGHHGFKTVSAQVARARSWAARAPVFEFTEEPPLVMRWHCVAPSRWQMAVLTGDFRFGARVVPFALMPHPRWAELLLPATQRLPPSLLTAVITHHLKPVMQGLGRLLETTPQIAAWPSLQVSSPAWLLGVKMQIKDSSEPAFDTLLEIGQVDAAAWAESLSSRALPNRSLTVSAWQLSLKVEIGWAAISVGELQSIDVADVLMIEPHVVAGAASDDQVPALLRVGATVIGQGWAGSAGFLIDTLFLPPKETSMSNEDPATDPVKSLSTQLHLRVRVVLDGGEFALSEIASWTVNTQLPLSIPVDSDRIRLEVGDRVIARGRLVAIDQQLGLEIAETYT
jgi:flagellar motor switch/type III secretory pathway protein FliN